VWLEIDEDTLVNMENVDGIKRLNAEIHFYSKELIFKVSYKSISEAKSNYKDLMFLVKNKYMRFKGYDD
jgi:hypothetical protein